MAKGFQYLSWFFVSLTISSSEVLGSSFAPHGTWPTCSAEEPFLTLWNINLDDCVYECHVRRLCNAVNYNRMTSRCDMLTKDDRMPTEHSYNETRKPSCVFVPKNNISSLAWVTDACQNCDNASVCDAASGNCTIKECRKLHVENAIIKGNMLVVGAKAIVECLDWYTLDRPNPQVVCQANGTWGDVPSCVQDAACGVPPDVTNAEAVMFNSATSHAEYLCLDGFSTLGTTSNAVLECRGDNTWADVNFTCISYCDPSWVHIGSSCYYTPGPPTTRNHVDAIDYCTAMDSYLLQLETQSESDAVKEYLQTTYGAANWWIGLSDLDVEDVWVWVESGTTATFQDWIIEPDEGRAKNFAVLQNTVGWEETTRYVLVVPVCEKM